jgi:signal transduction histidine kinase
MSSLPIDWPGEGKHRAIAFALAGALPLLAVVLFGETVTTGPRVLALVLPVLLAAWLGGIAPGLLATAVAAIPAAMLLTAAERVTDAGWLAWFVAQGVFISVLFERIRRNVGELSEEHGRLRADQRFQQAIAELAGDCAWQGRLTEGHLMLERVTAAFPRAIGMTIEEVNARGGWSSLVHEDDRAAMALHLRTLAEGGRVSTELCFDLRRGNVRFECEMWIPERDGDEGGGEGRERVVVGIVRDVTARHELVAQLRETKERYESTVMAARLILFELDYMKRQVTLGGNCEAVLGRWPAELSGELADWVRRLHPDDSARFEQVLLDAQERGDPFHLEYRVRHADGHYVAVDHHGAFAGGTERAARRNLVGFLRDITEQRRAEQSLKRREEQLRFALEGARVGLWEWDYDAEEVIDAEISGCLFGLPPSDASRRSALDRIHPQDRDAVLRSFMGAAEGRALYDCEYRVIWPDGSVHWLRSAGRRMEGVEPGARFLGVTYEVTAEKSAAEQIERLKGQLREKAREFETVFDLAPIGIGYATDPRCDVIVANEPLAAMLNRAPHGNVSFTAAGAAPAAKVFVKDREVPPSELPMQRAAATGRPVVDEESELRLPDGRTLDVVISAAPLFNERGEVRGCMGAFVDVTDRRRLERELQQRVGELRQSDRRKDEFLATLAHELRNPLAPIRNASMLLGLQDGSPQSIDWVRRVIDRQTDHLARLIDDLLDVSRITSDKMTLRLERVELNRVIESAVESVRSQLDAQRHRLSVEVPSGVWLQGDQVRLTQIFSNLLNNAVKYTSAGGSIVVKAEAEGGWVSVTVRDNGVGIPHEQLPHVFEMFYQVDRSIERAHAGLGIGLTLAERLVFMHGGEVAVSSAGIGRGSEFTVRLPLADRPARLEAPPPAAGRTVKGLKILVADDSVDSALTLTALLSAAGHDVQAVHDGFAALQRAAEFRPHVLVLDIGMPGLNGYDTCRRVRAEPWGRNAVIIAVTGWGSDEDRRRSREAGFDAHLVKPIDYTELQKHFSPNNVAL